MPPPIESMDYKDVSISRILPYNYGQPIKNLKSKIVIFPLMSVIECIPNFSEARRPEVVDQIVSAIESVPEVKLLDRSSDLDHNRTVLTFAGSPSAVEEAA